MGVNSTNDSIGHGVDGRVVAGFVLPLGPAVLGVVEMDMGTAVRGGVSLCPGRDDPC